MLLNEYEIQKLVNSYGLLDPFIPSTVREFDGKKVISYGLSASGYDLRLGAGIKLFKSRLDLPNVYGDIAIDPKSFDEDLVEESYLHIGPQGSYYIIPAKSYALGVVMERLNIPTNIAVVFLTKSTYAKSGLIVNCTSAQPGWEGYLTVELYNTTDFGMKIYIGEGITQALFFKIGDETYSEYDGNYLNQINKVTFPKV